MQTEPLNLSKPSKPVSTITSVLPNQTGQTSFIPNGFGHVMQNCGINFKLSPDIIKPLSLKLPTDVLPSRSPLIKDDLLMRAPTNSILPMQNEFDAYLKFLQGLTAASSVITRSGPGPRAFLPLVDRRGSMTPNSSSLSSSSANRSSNSTSSNSGTSGSGPNRMSYPREFKLMVINYYYTNGQNKYRTCKQYQITKSMLNGWLQKADKIEQSRPGSLKSGRSGRRPQFPDIEKQLFEIYRKNIGCGMKVGNRWIRDTARQLALKQCNEVELKGMCQFSERWLANFKRRFGINLTRDWSNNSSSSNDPGNIVEQYLQLAAADADLEEAEAEAESTISISDIDQSTISICQNKHLMLVDSDEPTATGSSSSASTGLSCFSGSGFGSGSAFGSYGSGSPTNDDDDCCSTTANQDQDDVNYFSMLTSTSLSRDEECVNNDNDNGDDDVFFQESGDELVAGSECQHSPKSDCETTATLNKNEIDNPEGGAVAYSTFAQSVTLKRTNNTAVKLIIPVLQRSDKVQVSSEATEAVMSPSPLFFSAATLAAALRLQQPITEAYTGNKSIQDILATAAASTPKPMAAPGSGFVGPGYKRHPVTGAVNPFDEPGKRGRKVQFPEVEEALFEKFRGRINEGLRVSNRWLQEEARRIASQVCPEHFADAFKSARCMFSEHWLHNFKKRFGISLKSPSYSYINNTTPIANTQSNVSRASVISPLIGRRFPATQPELISRSEQPMIDDFPTLVPLAKQHQLSNLALAEWYRLRRETELLRVGVDECSDIDVDSV